MKTTRLISIAIIALVPFIAHAQLIDPSMYESLEWRMIGPFRAGRTVGASGVRGMPNVFYIGLNNGGVWKTTDYGRTWTAIFDDQPTGSIGDLAVSLSDPNVIYVGTGEGLHRPDLAVGDGMFKSTDAGRTWAHIGLSDAQQIAGLAVHPSNPDEVFAAVLGHPYGPNPERGIFRSTDGGETWERVLFIDEYTGATQVTYDPADPSILYADMWSHLEGPWENARFSGDNSGLFKSTDGGDTWDPLRNGLPTSEEGLGRIGIGIAPSDANRIYATVDARISGGIYRSDDAGEYWTLVSANRRLWGRGGDFAEIKVHPKNPDIVFVGNIASYRSNDGGITWTSIKGAPGGDDYHRIWINPDEPDIMLFATDQGATITVNGGLTWSSWYNQPTAQLYHVTVDNQFPYWVYGGQQESGAIAVSSRGNGGQTSFRDWHGVGADEYAYVAPDPLNPEIVYGGRVVRYNRKTGQTQNVAPEAVRSGKYRILRSMPLLFSQADPKTLFFASNVLFKTTTGGDGWDIISPDLSRERPETPESIGAFATPDLADMPRRGVIYAVAPSPLNADIIWAGTDDGLVHVTRDGGETWHDVTPPSVTAWEKISQLDAGHFDTKTVYVAVNSIRVDDMRPHIFRTHDDGLTWTEIVTGIPDNGPVNVVREDPRQPGLLFAGTERAVYFSADDGDNWHPLRMNMPASSIRDLVIHEADIIVGTHGRSIWILDNIEPLRQIGDALQTKSAYLFRPPDATRVRWNMFSDTPLPPEEPTGQNPPDGAIIDYFLKSDAAVVTLEILGDRGGVIRRFSSLDEPERLDSTAMPHPTYWIRPPEILGTASGEHRFVWDLRYEQPPGARRAFSIAAVYRKTPSGPSGPFVHPGGYTVRLTVDGTSFTQPLTVRLDPRVEISERDLRLQFDYSMTCYDGFLKAHRARTEIGRMQEQIKGLLKGRIDEKIARSLRRSADTGTEIAGEGIIRNPDIVYSSVYAASPGEETLADLQTKFLYLLAILQAVDSKPTSQLITGVETMITELRILLNEWNAFRKDVLEPMNVTLSRNGLSPIQLSE